jgi:hypothetical protein
MPGAASEGTPSSQAFYYVEQPPSPGAQYPPGSPSTYTTGTASPTAGVPSYVPPVPNRAAVATREGKVLIMITAIVPALPLEAPVESSPPPAGPSSSSVAPTQRQQTAAAPAPPAPPAKPLNAAVMDDLFGTPGQYPSPPQRADTSLFNEQPAPPTTSAPPTAAETSPASPATPSSRNLHPQAAAVRAFAHEATNGRTICYVFVVGPTGAFYPLPLNCITPSGALSVDLRPGARPSPLPRSALLSKERREAHFREWPASLEAAKLSYGPFERIEEFPAMFGAILLDRLYLLVATKVAPAFSLPFTAAPTTTPAGAAPTPSAVYNVLGSKWIPVSLPTVPPIYFRKTDRNHLKQLLEFDLELGYYYCDVADLGTPFPHQPPDRMRLLQTTMSRLTGKAGATTPCSSASSATTSSETKIGLDPNLFSRAEGFPKGVEGGVMECDWSQYLRQPFAHSGVLFGPCCCSILYRGFAEGSSIAVRVEDWKVSSSNLDNSGVGRSTPTSSTATDPLAFLSGPPTQQVQLNVHLIGRQNTRNPGPRFYGRGLNEDGGAGNDHTYEMVMWYTPPAVTPVTSTPGGKPVDPASAVELRYARHTFLRGTVPLHWTNDFQKALGDATMIFGPQEEIFKRSGKYFSDTVEKLSSIIKFDWPQGAPALALQPRLGTAGDGQNYFGACPTLPQAERIALRCVSLLRMSQTGESTLTQHYAECIRRLSSDPEFQRVLRPDFVHLDWLQAVKDHELEGAVEELWHNVLPFFTSNDEPTCTVAAVSNSAFQLSPKQPRPQTNFYRINCADSLDRTNLGCFFTGLQVALDMLQALHVVQVLSPYNSTSQPQGGSPTPGDAASGAVGGRSGPGVASPQAQGYQQQQAYPQSPGAAYAAPSADPFLVPSVEPYSTARLRAPFFSSFRELRAKYPASLLRLLCLLYVNNGDCVAELYTSSGALHTNAIRQLVPGMKLAPLNAYLSAKRRFENVFEDKKKFRSLEAILGRRLPYHFPALNSPYYCLRLPFDQWGHALVLDGLRAEIRSGENRNSDDELCRHPEVVEMATQVIRRAWSQCIASGSNSNHGQQRFRLALDPEALLMDVLVAEGVQLPSLFGSSSGTTASPASPERDRFYSETPASPTTSPTSSSLPPPPAPPPLASTSLGPDGRPRAGSTTNDYCVVDANLPPCTNPNPIDPDDQEAADDELLGLSKESFVREKGKFVAVILFDQEQGTQFDVAQNLLRVTGGNFSLTLPNGEKPGQSIELHLNLRPYQFPIQPAKVETKEKVAKQVESAGKAVMSFGASLKKGFLKQFGK